MVSAEKHDLWQATVTGQPHTCEPWSLIDGDRPDIEVYYGLRERVALKRSRHCLCGAYRDRYELSHRPATAADKELVLKGLMEAVFA